MGVLDGKAALVTGGSRGIGAAIVRRLAADGAAVTFTYASSGTAADEVVAAVKDAGGQAYAVQADQADLDALPALFEAAAEPAGGLDILVCNAARSMVKPLADITVDDYDAMLTANVVSPGATDTDMFRESNPPEAAELLVGLTALGRVGVPADVADIVAFLAGPDSHWLTGQNLRASGGLLI